MLQGLDLVSSIKQVIAGAYNKLLHRTRQPVTFCAKNRTKSARLTRR